jgi:anti-anti-sigma factor
MDSTADTRTESPSIVSAAAPAVEFSQHVPGVSIVVLRGEHDLNQRADVQEALTRACIHEAVLVDLSQCTFIDSTIIGALIFAYQAQDKRGWCLGLIAPPATSIVSRCLHLAALDTTMPVYETRSAALTGLARGRWVG